MPRQLPNAGTLLLGGRGALHYADSGTIWCVVCVSDAVTNEESPEFWQQLPDEEWSGPTQLLPAVAGRALGWPVIASNDQGGVVIVVSRSMSNEIAVLRAR